MSAYFEEQYIKGILCFRTTPDGEWLPLVAAPRARYRRESTKDSPFDTLIDVIRNRMGYRTQIEAFDAIGIDSSLASLIRNGHRQVNPGIILRIYDVTGMSIAEIRRIGQIQKPRGNDEPKPR